MSCEPGAAAIEAFRMTVYDYYRRFPRAMPWRQTRDPYRILVSEIMLQQTQVLRVMAKYGEFIDAFPNLDALAAASRARVLEVWFGLGYNRRAVALHRLAQEVVMRGGDIPSDPETLASLPGIGRATACAIAAYAFNRPVVFIETNIRSVFIHHFFADKPAVTDDEILPLVRAALDREDPRQWYWALMDYGTHLKTVVPNPSRRSASHRRQPPFEGSRRQLRGRILRYLSDHGPQRMEDVAYAVDAPAQHLTGVVRDLEAEGFLTVHRDCVELQTAAPSAARSPEEDAQRGSKGNTA